MKSRPLIKASTTRQNPPTPRPSEVVAFSARCTGKLEYRQIFILCLASAIESDSRKLMAWFHDDPIAQLNNYTAKEMLDEGLDDQLEKFLLAVADIDRT